MSNNFEIYFNSVMRLTATLVLKDETTCEVINARLKRLGHDIDDLKPETWKYYLNLAGRYHSTNTPMRVESMDNKEEIDFTVENLLLYRKTWRDYQYGSRYYNELVEKYPDQQMLIDGILNPVDINEAIAAEDHTILYYDPDLVESREANLISELQYWINAQFVRWDNTDYRLNNSLFIAARLMILFMFMPLTILNIRLVNCHTLFVHSYHIKKYLASFGPLDSYYSAMNEFQRLYFYRDIRYLMRNNGQSEIFKLLTDNVLTERRLPLAKYTIEQNDSSLPTAMDPLTQFTRSSINGIPSALGEDIKNTSQLLFLQRTLARSNAEETPYAEVYIPEIMEKNLTSQANTKVLESNVLDLKESEPYTLAEVLLNEWIYLADKGLYTSVVTLTLPNGGESIKLTMRDAYILYQYVYMLRAGWQLQVIPPLMAKRVRRMPLPTFEELRGICAKDTVQDAFIHEALRANVDITSYVSVDGFVLMCVDVQKRMLLHRDLYCYRQDLYQYAEIKQMTDRFYADVPVDLDQGQVYGEWLAARNISVDGYSPGELNDIMLSLLSQATGKELRITQSLKDVHRAMLDIMGQLSSYSVQFIQQINEEAVVMLDWGHLRHHYLGGEAGQDLQTSLPRVDGKVGGRGKSKAVIEADLATIQDIYSRTKHTEALPLELTYEMSGKKEYIAKGMIIGATVGAITTPSVDLAVKLTDQLIKPYAVIEQKPIAELFDKVTSDDFQSL